MGHLIQWTVLILRQPNQEPATFAKLVLKFPDMKVTQRSAKRPAVFERRAKAWLPRPLDSGEAFLSQGGIRDVSKHQGGWQANGSPLRLLRPGRQHN